MIELFKYKRTELHMANNNLQQNEEIQEIDYEAMETELSQKFEEHIADLEVLKEQRDKIGTPENLATAVIDAAVESFNNNLAQQLGEGFIHENDGMTLDLRKDAHYQTVEDFAEGKFADHNPHKIDYAQKHKEFQSNFERDAQGKIKYHTDRTGKIKENLVKGARIDYDKNRPSGSTENKTDMDHTVAAASLIRDPSANLFMSKEERIAFANSPQNLNEISSSWNRSKGDLSMSDWLNHPNSNGQTPKEIFGISDEQAKVLIAKDTEARSELQAQKQAGKDKVDAEGKASRRAEGARILKGAGKAVLMSLMAAFVKEILKELILWLKEKGRSLSNLMDHFKSALSRFIINLKDNLFQSAKTAATTVVTAIFEDVVTLINKAITFAKQSWGIVKQVVAYMKDPEHKKESSTEMMAGISKIIVVGLAAVGTIAFSEVVSKGLTAVFPALSFGGIANMIGLLISGIVMSIISTLIMKQIDNFVARKASEQADYKLIEKGNEILQIQEAQIAVAENTLEFTKSATLREMSDRHVTAKDEIQKSLSKIFVTEKKDEENDVISNHKEEFEKQTASGKKQDDELNDLLNLI